MTADGLRSYPKSSWQIMRNANLMVGTCHVILFIPARIHQSKFQLIESKTRRTPADGEDCGCCSVCCDGTDRAPNPAAGSDRGGLTQAKGHSGRIDWV